MKKIFLLSLVIILITIACTDPNTIGLEIQPDSDNIIISSMSSAEFNSTTKSEDSLQTNNAFIQLLGEIDDVEFGNTNIGNFYTQILLTENNSTLGSNPVVDSVILSYTYSGYYGDLEDFTNLEVSQIYEDIYKDSIYYSNSFNISPGSIDNVEEFMTSTNSDDPFLKVKLKNEFGQSILNLGEDILKDNETFLEHFKGISVLALGSTILYLNPNGSKSFLKIYYNNDENSSDTLSLDFELGGDAARINLFNQKNDPIITEDNTRLSIQSMAGYKTNITIDNLDAIKDTLAGKVINHVSMTFNVIEGTTSEHAPHEKLVLVRVNSDGDNVFLSDFTIEGDAYFGGTLENGEYTFNITRYFHQLLYNESFTNELYLLPAGALVNANRTILDKDIKLKIHYSEL